MNLRRCENPKSRILNVQIVQLMDYPFAMKVVESTAK